MIGTGFGTGTPFGYPTQQFNPYGATLQSLPHQLQQVQQLQYVQHQQLQQLLHAITAQLGQLQQLIQLVPQQIQQLQQGASFQQPFISTPWGITSQAIGAQPSHVM